MRFRILGSLEVFDGSGWTGLGAGKWRSLLAALLVGPNTTRTIDQLVDELWGDAAPKSAVTQIHGYVMRLRRAIGDPEGRLLVTTSQGYRLALGDADTDAAVFADRTAQGTAALRDGRVELAAGLLTQALDLWRGPALADVAPTPAVEAEAARLTEQRLATFEARVEADLGCGRHATVLGELRRFVAEHPLREEPWRQLMVALHRGGHRAEALRTFQRLRRTLVDELGIEPCAAVRQVHQRLLADDDSAVPRQLPPMPAFIGRASELDALDSLLAGHGAVAISGVAGVGKTALALRWAHRAADRFPDGQLYMNLRGYDTGPPVSAAEALARFLHALGVAADGIPPDEDGRAALYRTLLAGRRVLVVLDNAANPDQVRPLLPGGPVVVTSRDDLRGLTATHGVRGLALEVLAHEDALVLLANLLGAARTAAEAECAAELAALCGHLPLALRIVGANLAASPGQRIAGYVARLRAGNRLTDLAVAGDRTAAVRAAFDLSYDSVPEPARRLFTLLGLVPGPDFDVHAAAALLDTDAQDAAGRLDQLAAAHLVEPAGTDRFTWHDLVRLYARERAAQEPPAALRRLLGHYLSAGRAAARLVSPQAARLPDHAWAPGRTTLDLTTYADGMSWLEAERANLIAAIGHAAAHGFGTLAWQLAYGLRSYLFTHRLGDDWLAAADAGHRAATEAGDHLGMAAMRLSLGHSYGSLGDFRRTGEYYGRAVANCRRAGWRTGETTALNGVALAHLYAGSLHEAGRYLTSSLTIAREMGSVACEARALANLGYVRQLMGDLPEAADSARRTLALYDVLPYDRGRCIVIDNLGSVCRLLGETDLALAMHTEALRLGRRAGSVLHQATALAHLAATHRDAGRLEVALSPAREAVRLARTGVDHHDEIETLTVLASILTRLDELAEADRCYAEILRATEISGLLTGRIEALIGLAELRARQHRTGAAASLAGQAVELAEESGYRLAALQALALLAALDTTSTPAANSGA